MLVGVLLGVVLTLTLIVAVLGILTIGLTHQAPDRAGAPGGFLGLSSPVHLLSYQHADGLPSYCRRDAILDQLAAQARRRGCEVSSLDLGGMPTRMITCRLPPGIRDEDKECPASYVAQIWQERWAGSMEDYELEMYARVHTTCAREHGFSTFHASDEITFAVERQSDEVTRLLASCRPAGGAGATP